MAKGIDKTTGKRCVLLMANPSFAFFSVNMTSGKLPPHKIQFRGNWPPARRLRSADPGIARSTREARLL
jgi:hypothetical protein